MPSVSMPVASTPKLGSRSHAAISTRGSSRSSGRLCCEVKGDGWRSLGQGFVVCMFLLWAGAGVRRRWVLGAGTACYCRGTPPDDHVLQGPESVPDGLGN